VKEASSDMLVWQLEVTGPEDTPYEGGKFYIEITYPSNYPFKPPKVLFKTKIYHPSVKSDTGEICQDVFEKNWAPYNNIHVIIERILSLLISPIPESDMEPEIAKLYNEDYHLFEAKAKEWTNTYAK
jgi:ubiquitin-conjugating enzyme E2 D/E